nr:site-specific integrase [uncultured Tolumonas sp.]
MAVDKLTDKTIKSYLGKKQEKQLTIADGLGLSVRISPAGGISWLYRYRIDGVVIWLTLGVYPDMTLKVARQERDKCRTWLADGKNPKTERQLSKAETLKPATVRDVLEFWLDNYAESKRANAAKHRQQFEKWIFPKVGDLPLDRLEKHHWIDCFTERAKLYPVAAGYVLQNLKQALNTCSRRGYKFDKSIIELELDDIGGARQAKKSRRLVANGDWSELAELVKWIDNNGAEHGGYHWFYWRNLLLIVIYFGCRTQEIRLSKVTEWDFTKKIWTVPVENNKTGKRDKSKGQDGVIVRPIPDSLIPWLKDLAHQNEKNEYILGELKSPEQVSMYGGKLWMKLKHKDPWTLHDLRRTVATGLSDLGIAPHVVESLLGHALGGVAGIYNHSQYLPEKLDALTKWVNRLGLLKSDTSNVTFLPTKIA